MANDEYDFPCNVVLSLVTPVLENLVCSICSGQNEFNLGLKSTIGVEFATRSI
jgi:hypothetical protein